MKVRTTTVFLLEGKKISWRIKEIRNKNQVQKTGNGWKGIGLSLIRKRK